MTKHRRPIKGLGQNFLVDNHVVNNIIRSANLGSDDYVLEIGPGRGALTSIIAENVARLVLIEFDHALAAELQETYRDDNRITVIDADVLGVDLAKIMEGCNRWKVVANLPYNISTAVLFRLLDVRSFCSRLVLMLQREVGERLVAPPNCSDYGVTTLLLGLWFDIKREFIVRPGSFNPPPKVDSAVLSFTPLPKPRAEVGDEELYKRLVKAAFGMRRKTLNNCLKAAELIPAEELESTLKKCNIDGKRRGETLSLNEFAALSRFLCDKSFHKSSLRTCP